MKSDRKKKEEKKEGKWKQQNDIIPDIMTSTIQSHLQSNLMIWVSVNELLYLQIPWILIFCFLHLLFKVVVNITFVPKKNLPYIFIFKFLFINLFRYWYLVSCPLW